MIKKVISCVLLFIGLCLCLFLLGEAYFRMHTFGPKGFNLSQFFPDSRLKEIVYFGDGIPFFKPNRNGYIYGAPFRTNGSGLWEDKDYPVKKPESVLRIACFGESFSMGTGVLPQDNYSSVLEKKLTEFFQNHPETEIKGAEVINFSTPGDGYDKWMIKRMEKVCPLYKPDIILIGITSNFFPSQEDSAPFEFRDEGGIRSNFFMLSILQNYRENVNRYFARLMRKSFRPEAESRFDRDKIREYFKEIKRYGIPGENRVILVLIRKLFFLNDPGYHRDFQEILKEECDSFGFYFINTYASSAYQDLDTGDLILYPGNEHPNSRAHAIYADIIYNYLTGNLFRSS